LQVLPIKSKANDFVNRQTGELCRRSVYENERPPLELRMTVEIVAPVCNGFEKHVSVAIFCIISFGPAGFPDHRLIKMARLYSPVSLSYFALLIVFAKICISTIFMYFNDFLVFARFVERTEIVTYGCPQIDGMAKFVAHFLPMPADCLPCLLCFPPTRFQMG
jgi:hypothetical protein